MRVPINALLELARLVTRRVRVPARVRPTALLLGLVAALVYVLLETSPIKWLPEPDVARSLLGALLAAQAAIAALTLAVTVFVMQRASTLRDVDDRGYRAYIHGSRVRPLFRSSMVAVGVTGTVLLAQEFVGPDGLVAEATPGLRNLTLVAVAAFGINLVLPLMLFERAIWLAQPNRWRTLRSEVRERDVRDAVQIFLRRYRRATTEKGGDEAGFAALLPDPGERLADEAILSLLDDARWAMDERRLTDLKRSLASVGELVTYAMDEIEREGIGWGPPGSQPQWPPLRELASNLYSFREDVIRRGRREHIRELLSFDYWLLTRGVERRCGELFTAALGGYRLNYEIAARPGNEDLRETFRDRTWLVADQTLYAVSPEEAFPYATHLVRHQEQLLSDAMHADRRADYEELARGFDRFLSMTRLGWKAEAWPPSESTKLYEQLEQQYRIALMGLGGRAAILTRSGRIADAVPYLEAARGKYDRPQQLADDLAQALIDEEHRGFSLWSDWEMEGADNFEARTIEPDRYPLTCFGILLLDLATSRMPALGLHGSAKRALEWFTANSGDLEAHVRADADTSMERRREVAVGALREAVQRDDTAEDDDIIRRKLSAERIAAFTANVYASAFTADVIEPLFARTGAFLYLPADADGAPGPRGTRKLIGRGFLAQEREHARIGYASLDGGSWGESLADDLVQRLCEALDEVSPIRVSLDSSQELLRSIDAALERLSPQGEIIVLLAGDWLDVIGELEDDAPSGYQPWWQLTPAAQRGATGRYLGHPIIRGPHDGDRRLYVVEPGGWGCFVRAQVEGDQDLLVEVDAISLERARELLGANPNSFSQEPDEESKLRKWQTFVEVGVAARTEFRVVDPSRARRVIDS